MSNAAEYLTDLFGLKPDAPAPAAAPDPAPASTTARPGQAQGDGVDLDGGPLDLADAGAVWRAALDRLAGELPADVLAGCRAAGVRWEPGAADHDPDAAPATGAPSMDDRTSCPPADGRPDGAPDLDFDGWPVDSFEPQGCPTCPGLLTWQDAGGRWRCERCDADALARSQRLVDGAAKRRAAISTDAAATPWPDAAADFVLLLAPDDLPDVPFRLNGRATVHDAGRFLCHLRQCIRLGIASPGERQDIADLRRVAMAAAGETKHDSPGHGTQGNNP